ncbi:hypothetical protein ACQP25_44510 (plasmid) [Microtetraspora malaysiensis]|uniref:hypothetical protein n=1 Tax=Microtetraspora malaysiensis TaxID=161358 RepID=UPI003D8C6744
MSATRRAAAAAHDVPAPRWRCRVTPCRLAGRWQAATSNEEADQRSHGHYVREHWTPTP